MTQEQRDELEKEARTFACKYVGEQLEKHPILNGWDVEQGYIAGHTSGDAKGFQRCLAELAGKAGAAEAFEDWRDSYRDKLGNQLVSMREAWINGRTPLLAQLAAKDKKIAELEQDGAQMSAYQCIHPEALTIREGQDGITCAKQERIAALEGELAETYRRLDEEWELYHTEENYHPSPWMFINALRSQMPLAAKLAEKKECGL